ncbi:hypothetical protein TKK_0015426 [Trichogramma kaykai]|uniref:Transposable element P transposase n=1 Tax=Trichogramma kaykai TaxID=54128 RepID=A0ABD2WAY7_9HYME
MQLNHIGKRKCEEDEKQFALGLYYKSPKAYKFLLNYFNLPCLTNIYKWVNSINLRPGVNVDFLEQLKIKLKSKNNYEKLSVLMWDEMSIKKGLSYNTKLDLLEGFQDMSDEFGGRNSEIVSSVLVFMIGGLMGDWKQPFMYLPTAGSVPGSELSKIIKRVVERALDVGFDIRHMVCDQLTSNRKAVGELGVTLENPFIYVDKKKLPSAMMFLTLSNVFGMFC